MLGGLGCVGVRLLLTEDHARWGLLGGGLQLNNTVRFLEQEEDRTVPMRGCARKTGSKTTLGKKVHESRLIHGSLLEMVGHWASKLQIAGKCTSPLRQKPGLRL